MSNDVGDEWPCEGGLVGDSDESDQDTEDPDFSVTYAYPKATLPSIRFVWAATTSAPLDKAPSIDGNGREFTLDLEFSQAN